MAGTLIYNDLFTIYPYENQLYVVRMTGDELLKLLEASYDHWIRTVKGPGEHVLNIRERDDPRTGQKGWSFAERSYNFDSAAGICYTVDVTRPAGERVQVASMADGSAFDPAAEYAVAMTSYRASGGGGLMKAAGIDTDKIDDRVISRYPEIREILYDYLKKNGVIDPAVVGNPAVIGSWRFVPDAWAPKSLESDLKLLFGRDE